MISLCATHLKVSGGSCASRCKERCLEGQARFLNASFRCLTEGEIGRDDGRGTLVEAADQVEQQLAAGLGEWQIAQLVEDDEVEAGEIVGRPTLAARSALGFEAIDEIDSVEETTA
jgi:hypothetical protein